MDRLEAMTVLMAAVEGGSLSAGARRLNAALPSVSRKISELERHLGTTLLIRTSRSLQLTEAGRIFVEDVRDILARVGDAERRASGEHLLLRGELSLTVPLEFGRIRVVPIALAYLKQNPNVSLNMVFTDRVVHLINENVDVAVRLGDLQDSSLLAVRAGSFRMLTCASPAYLELHGRPNSPADLHQHHAVAHHVGDQSLWTYASDGERIVARPQMRLSVNTAAACAAAAIGGAGVARLFDYQVEDEVRSGRLVRILERYEADPIPVHLVYPQQALMPAKLRAFLNWTAPRLRAACRSEVLRAAA